MKQFLILVVISFVIVDSIFLYQYAYHIDKKLHISFCAVGNGEAIIIRMPSGEQLLIDGGPDSSVLGCLDSYIPFWRRAFDLVILDTQDKNSYSGLIYILDRYIIKRFALYNSIVFSQEMQGLKESLVKSQSVEKVLQNGAVVRFGDGVVLRFSEEGVIVNMGDFVALLRGEAQSHQLSIKKPTVLQVMRSKDLDFLETISPELIVLSGEQNSVYAYARKRVLLSNGKNLEIVSDGRKWWVRK